jgi:KDO2-lipid IV(A) lauroyltransferase
LPVRVRRLLDYAVFVVARVVLCVIQAMSIDTAERLARRLAWLCGRVLKIRASVIEENLRHAFPEMSPDDRRQLARRMWEHLFLMVVEVVHARRMIHETNWREFVRLEGVAPLVRAMLSERPVLIVTAHFGNFEIGGFMLGMLGFPTFSVARDLDNPYLDRLVGRFRRSTGQTILAKNGQFERIEAALESGATMALLADQHAGPKGCWVGFFGRPASAHKAIALLSLDHDAPVAVVCCQRRPGRPMQFQMRLVAMLDPRELRPCGDAMRELTQWYTSRLEEMIRMAPEQYWWLHRRWREPPAGRRRQAAKAA